MSAGLVIGVAMPALAAVLEPWVPPLVVVLLFINAYRSGDKIRKGLAENPLDGLPMVFGLQLLLPITILGVLMVFSPTLTPFWVAAILMLSSPSLTGTPNFVAMSGHDPSGAMRLLIIGTLVFPLTALVTLWALPGVDGVQAISATARLAATILIVVVAGVLTRRYVDTKLAGRNFDTSCDGASAILLGIVVVGLMVDVGPLLRADPARLMLWIAAVMVLNFALQFGALFLFRSMQLREAVAGSAVAGNRNTALFLIVLPREVIEMVMLFVGCYQIPMYLTPMVMRRVHQRR